MRSRIVLLVVLTASLSVAIGVVLSQRGAGQAHGAWTDIAGRTPSSRRDPTIVLEPKELQFDPPSRGQAVVRTLEVTNRGDRTRQIFVQAGGCGCFAVDPEHRRFALAPGTSRRVPVRLYGYDERRARTLGVTLYGASSGSRLGYVPAHVMARAAASRWPSDAELGSVAAGAPLRVRALPGPGDPGALGSTWRLTMIDSARGTHSDVVQLARGTDHAPYLPLRAPDAPGPFVGSAIPADGATGFARDRIRFRGVVTAGLVVDPAAPALGLLTSGGRRQVQLRVDAPRGDPDAALRAVVRECTPGATLAVASVTRRADVWTVTLELRVVEIEQPIAWRAELELGLGALRHTVALEGRLLP